MKREFLEGLKIEGLTKEVIDSIMAEHGKEVQAEQAKTAAKEAELKTANETIATRDKDLEELKKLDPEGLKTKFDELEKKYADEKKELEKQVAETKKSAAIKLALGDQVQDADLVLGLLDGDKITLDDKGQINGLEDQLKGLKESKGFLFKSDDDPSINGTKPKDGGEPNPADDEAAVRAVMGLPPEK